MIQIRKGVRRTRILVPTETRLNFQWADEFIGPNSIVRLRLSLLISKNSETVGRQRNADVAAERIGTALRVSTIKEEAHERRVLLTRRSFVVLLL